MEKFVTKEGRGSLFVNDRQDKPTDPYAGGEAMVGGVLYKMNAWKETSRDGKKRLSLSFRPANDVSPAKKSAAPFDDGTGF